LWNARAGDGGVYENYRNGDKRKVTDYQIHNY
jgi:hypothetical protein